MQVALAASFGAAQIAKKVVPCLSLEIDRLGLLRVAREWLRTLNSPHPTTPTRHPSRTLDIFEGTEQIQQLVISRSITVWKGVGCIEAWPSELNGWSGTPPPVSPPERVGTKYSPGQHHDPISGSHTVDYACKTIVVNQKRWVLLRQNYPVEKILSPAQ